MISVTLWVSLLPCAARAQETGREPAVPVINPGTTLLGLGGSLTAVEGVSHVSAAVRGGYFIDMPLGPGGLEADASYTYLAGMHQLDLEGRFTWGTRIGGSSAYPYIGLAGGGRIERIGSFWQTRYPLGLDLGVRALVSWDALLDIAYRYRRITADPVADYSEHRLGFTLAILLGNSP